MSGEQKDYVEHSDALSWLSKHQDNQFDFMCTDPPYGLSKPFDIHAILKCWLNGETYIPKGKGFMGRAWDAVVPGPELWRECLRVMAPGAHGIVMAATRNIGVMEIALRMAGFEIRDTLSWLFGSGMPKSKQVPGWTGSGLKPSWEPMILVRKPIEKGLTLTQNAEKWGTGGLNIDACRIEVTPEEFESWSKSVEYTRSKGGSRDGSWKNSSDLSGANPANPLGKFPANTVMDEEAGSSLDQSTTNHKAFGGPSRFFYSAKASKSDRDEGLDEFRTRDGGEMTMRAEGSTGVSNPRAGAGRGGDRKNPHPTVKPTSLTRWQVRLISLPGHIGFDPFSGSGSTGKACALEGREFYGCEMMNTPEEPYVDIANARIRHALENK